MNSKNFGSTYTSETFRYADVTLEYRDTPKTEWVCQSIAQQTPSIENCPKKISSKANPGVGNDSPDHKIQHETLVQRFWHRSKHIKTIFRSIENIEPSTLHPLSSQHFYASGSFPLQSFVRGHGPGYSAHPRPPWPRRAFPRPSRGRSRLPNAAVFCLRSPGPRAISPQAEPNEPKGRKF